MYDIMTAFDRWSARDKTLFDDTDQALSTAMQYSMVLGTVYEPHIDMDRYRRFERAVQLLDVKANTRIQHGHGTFKEWMIVEAGEIATNGVIGFQKTLDKLINVLGTFMKRLKTKYQASKITDERIGQVFDSLHENIEAARKMNGVTVRAPLYESTIKRLEGFTNIIQTIIKFAEEGDENAFDSDRTWEQFASMSANCVKARLPDDGSFFRYLEWQEPYTKDTELLKSEWGSAEKLDELKKTLLKVRSDCFGEIENALAFLKKKTTRFQSEVAHVRKNNAQEVVVKYARGYVATKFVYELQDILIKELLWDLTALPKMLTKKQEGKSNLDVVKEGTKPHESEQQEESSQSLFTLEDILSEEGIIDSVKEWIKAVKDAHVRKMEQKDRKKYEQHLNSVFDNYRNFLEEIESGDSAKDVPHGEGCRFNDIMSHLKTCPSIAKFIMAFDPFRASGRNSFRDAFDKAAPDKVYDKEKHEYRSLLHANLKFEGSSYDSNQAIDVMAKQAMSATADIYQLYDTYERACDRLSSVVGDSHMDDQRRRVLIGVVKEYLAAIKTYTSHMQMINTNLVETLQSFMSPETP